MTVALLLALVSTTQTSTVPEWAQPITIPQEDPEKERLEKRDERARERQEDKWELEHLELQGRWRRDRGFRFALHGAARFTVAGGQLYGVDAALGFSVRFSRLWSLQARAAIGTGYGDTGGAVDEKGPLLDTGIDASFRVGANRFYFGLGPFGRVWKIFDDERAFEYGGGGLIEFGWWLGDDRQIDLNMRFLGAGFESYQNQAEPPLFLGTSLGIGWIW